MCSGLIIIASPLSPTNVMNVAIQSSGAFAPASLQLIHDLANPSIYVLGHFDVVVLERVARDRVHAIEPSTLRQEWQVLDDQGAVGRVQRREGAVTSSKRVLDVELTGIGNADVVKLLS
jgi:hypothetical protein